MFLASGRTTLGAGRSATARDPFSLRVVKVPEQGSVQAKDRTEYPMASVVVTQCKKMNNDGSSEVLVAQVDELNAEEPTWRDCPR